MLQLKNITKVYAAGENAVQALDGVSLNFRHNEFVSILGPSGCGKTTLLNIVGGLDRYSDGDLVIGGKSTKQFKDRDWDTYRNLTIGFVFQSYNLIPHQSVLQNVELALTLSGVPKAERRRRAKAALEQVGLGDQLRKKPSQMSGGQMQRVAIARALVNDPAIILADEPTGALDTETSVQMMELLKEVARDRLVVMVTHNPDLAEHYSTRIIRMLDGKITDDSAPLTEEEIAAEQALEQEKAAPTDRKQRRREKKPSMSFATAFGLSLKNLFTKKGRTTLTAFAGSIGIIGIALISAVSNGMTTYIDAVQEDTLSSYPITLEATHTDLGSIMAAFMGSAASSGDHEKDAVYQKAMMYELVNALNNRQTSENDLKTFKSYLEQQMADKGDNDLRDAINGIQYGYNLNLLVYTRGTNGLIQRSDTEELLMELMVEQLGMDMSGFMSMGESYGFGGMMTMGTELWQEILPGTDGALINPLLHSQYDVIDGRWPEAYNEIVLVVDENNEIDDMTLYALGLKSKEDMEALSAASKGQYTIEIEEQHWSYEEIRAKEYRVILPFDCYTEIKDENGNGTGLYEDTSEKNLGELYENAVKLKVTGIIRPKEDASSTILTGNIAYTSALTAYIIEQGQNAPVVQAQLANPEIDILTGLPFKPTTNSLTAEELNAYLETLDAAIRDRIRTAYHFSIPYENLTKPEAEVISNTSLEDMKSLLLTGWTVTMGEEEANKKLNTLNDDAIKKEYGKVLAQQRMNLYKSAEFILHIGKLDEGQKANTYVDVLVANQIADTIAHIRQMNYDQLMEYITNQMTAIGSADMGGDTQQFIEYIQDKDEKVIQDICISLIQSDSMQMTDTIKAQIQQALEAQGMASPIMLAAALEQSMATYTVDQFANYYDNVLAFSDTSYKDQLVTIGKLDLDSPATINIYASSFENKDTIEAAIEKYNEGKDELQKIVYTDYVGLMMSSVTTIINAITYVLIAFVAISLIVSSIMIGVITLISVQERTKEIGILRSIGASKRNVSSMFNAETVIIGFSAGLLGVLITYALCIPINLILHHLTGIPNLKAILPVNAAVILVGISVLLTLFAGIIPSRSAAKKDPVVALRTE